MSSEEIEFDLDKIKKEVKTESVSEQTFCKNCGKELSENVKFCGGCGASTKIQPFPKQIFCSNCGKELKDDAKFCGNCGIGVKSVTTSQNAGLEKPDTVTKEPNHSTLIVKLVILAVVLVILVPVIRDMRKSGLEQNIKSWFQIKSIVPDYSVKGTEVKRNNYSFEARQSIDNDTKEKEIAAANVKDYERQIKGVVFVEEGANLNLRPCPQADDDCPSIDKIPPDTELDILGETGNGEWYKVKYDGVTAFTTSKFVIEKEKWDSGLRRSYIGTFVNFDVYDSEEFGELIYIEMIDTDTGQPRYFSGYYSSYNGSDISGKRVKLLIDKEDLVEKIELLR